jgi:mannose-6-phosphate isomerase-like protein (cupin superfamily)
MADLVKFNKLPVAGKVFSAVTYRQFFDNDEGGLVGIDVYKKGAKRYEKGYSVCRIAEARPVKNRKDAKSAVQPDHYHPQRHPFIILGISGKRTMLVGGKKFNIVPGTLLQIGKGEHHKTINLDKSTFVTLELWHSAPHDDEIMLTDKGEESVVEMLASGKLQ